MVKTFLRKVFYWGLSTPEEFQRFQKAIRDTEWNAVRDYIPSESSFLDIGCGSGYSMMMAVKDRDCIAVGVDPNPTVAGVHHDSSLINSNQYQILQGTAELLPFEDNRFDVVYSSHTLEHVADVQLALNEILRVIKPNGIVLLGVPTSTMSFLRLITILLFDTHRRLFAIISWPFRPSLRQRVKFMDLLIPPSHGQPGRTIFFDLIHYQTKKWRKLLSANFEVTTHFYPAIYPFPDYIQLFKLRKLKSTGSSVFFVCMPIK